MSNGLPPPQPTQSAIARLKPYLRWVIVGGTLFFLAKAFKDHWQEVAAIRISPSGWGLLGVALLMTLVAHLWTGWVWGWILWELKQPVSGRWAIGTYLKTNIAKYLPGNVWHFYGRITTTHQIGVPFGTAALSVLLEPLLMAAAALIVALISIQQSAGLWPLLSLGVVLAGVHPRVLNPLLRRLGRVKLKHTPEGDRPDTPQLRRYPVVPLLGEVLFLVMRSAGFLAIMPALGPLQPSQVLPVMGAFSVAWLLGLVVPGAPGGIGVFEATAIALLQSQIPAGIILSGVALYRLINTMAEALGAGLAIAGDRLIPLPGSASSQKSRSRNE